MRRNYFLSRNRDALLEPCDGKLSRTVLRGESPRKGADLLDGDHHGEDRAPNEDISHNVLLFCARFVGLRFDTHAGAQFVEAVGNNLLTGLEAGIDHPHRPDSLA